MNEEKEVTTEDVAEATEEVVEQVAEQASSLLQKEEETQSGEVERPEWLPEKFKSVEDFTKSYSELESMLSLIHI